MEPTPIVPPVVIPSNKKMTKIIIAILVLILIAIAYTMIMNKSEAPSDINNPNLQNLIASQEESKQLTDDINSATTFDNESSLAEIDSQFQ